MSGIEAYDLGKEDGIAEERERIIKLLETEIERVSNPMLVDREYLDGIEVALELVKGETNG
jgi:hypothetical protein